MAPDKQTLGFGSPNIWLLMLSTDLATFCYICSTTELYLSPFSTYLSTCGVGRKPSKMAGNSATSPSWSGLAID